MKKLIPFAIALFLAGCTQEAPKEKKVKAPPEPVSAQSAFFKMFGQARQWANDAQVLKVEPVPLTAIKEKGGKWPAWRATFTSDTKRRMKSFQFSVVESDGVHEGVFGGTEESWGGSRGQEIAFLMQAFKIDSPAAIDTAIGKSAEYIKKHPDVPITVVLGKTKEDGNPTWRVIWGASASTSNYSVYVDATSGQYLKTMH
ncbi:MAG: hypothetical protein U0Q16_31845 [Bryobacteraceae bacterium]